MSSYGTMRICAKIIRIVWELLNLSGKVSSLMSQSSLVNHGRMIIYMRMYVAMRLTTVDISPHKHLLLAIRLFLIIVDVTFSSVH